MQEAAWGCCGGKLLKRAFTLIELLVVIAIIAILAAILFPVFAQAKLAAKKTASISNQKQLGLGILMYANDYDDMYPREDGCTLNDSEVTKFNNMPAGTNPAPFCNGTANPGGFAFRDNHYSWSKWIMPYIKSVQLIYHPVIQPTAGGLQNGEVDGGYALNLAITGALDTWPTVQNYGIRNSWLGGSTTSIPQPADAWLIMEQIDQSVVGGYEYGTTTTLNQVLTLYPLAVKEHWEGYFYKNGTTDNNDCFATTQLDPVAAPFSESVPLSFCDGHTKAVQVGQFLANTPTAAQFNLSYNTYLCGFGVSFYGNGQPKWNQPWPMWGLQ